MSGIPDALTALASSTRRVDEWPMRLVTRLVLSHAMLAALLVVALGVMLAALGDIYRQVREVRERDLATIDEEEELHRAGWAIEVAARHGIDACDQGADPKDIASTFVVPKSVLEEKIRTKGESATKSMRSIVERYLRLTEELMRGDICAELRAPKSRRERLRLDEELTEAWIGRLYELHRSLGVKEDEVVRAGRRAISQGLVLGIIAVVAAWMVSTITARGVTQPLAALARAAHRVGRGDFSPIPETTGPREVVELSRDLDRMRNHLAELDALKQSFLASVSHELRTPLGKIREALALLADGTAGPVSDRQRSVVEIARRACEAEIRLVTTLLDLSRLRAGKLLRAEKRQSIDDAVQEALAAETADASARGITIELEAPGQATPALLDGPLLERAVANLIRNAVSVSPDGSTVNVSREMLGHGPDQQAGSWVRVRVRDHGPGVPSEIRDTLFDAFATRDVPGRRGGVGIGLGLALAREVARAHGGDLRLADPAPGQTTFEVWIPLRAESPVSEQA